MAGLQSALEERVVEEVRSRRDELVDLVGELVALDTTARDVSDPPRDEERLQRLLKGRLEAIGAETDLWEPEPTVGDRFLPGGLSFRGRPQLAARLRGHGAGRNLLLLLGHIDAVSAEPIERWTSDPFKAAVRDGKLFGRGACDMKGGLGAMLVALETLHRLGVKTKGDIVWCSVTDEESSGAGGVAAVARGVKADAGICAEPTGFDTWVACRGSLTPIITIEGRPGHAEMTQPHWRDGGAVNAIEKLPLILTAIERLRHEWRSRLDCRHPYLDPGDIVPTVLHAGEWSVTYPSEAVLTCEVTYLPTQVDAEGTGKRVEREICEAITAAAAGDPWLAEHPLKWLWDCDVVPAEIPADHPLVTLTMQAAVDLDREGTLTGFESWHDGATFIRAGTPTLCFGPGDRGALHRLDEFAPVDHLEISEEQLDRTLAVNVKGVVWCGQAAALAMLESGRPCGGHIVNIASTYGEVCAPECAAYCASKGGVRMLTKVMAVELGPLGLHVNAVAPGWIRTAMSPFLQDPQLEEEIRRTIPVGYIGSPEHIASVVYFLTTADAEYINGETIFADGGWIVQ